MASGLSRKQRYGITYRYLNRLSRKLEKRGIDSVYRDWGLKGFFGGHTFEIWIAWGNFSSGESVGLTQLKVDGVMIRLGCRSVFDILTTDLKSGQVITA